VDRVTPENRKGLNEAWFREVNERLEDRAAGRKRLNDTFEIVCECDREECTERITISFADYEAVRRSPTGFLVVRGHVDLASERVERSTELYDVVEKFGDPGLVARIENPRNGQELPDGTKAD
jgi:hypothetical protein